MGNCQIKYELLQLKNNNKKVKILPMPKQGHMPTDPNVIYSNIQELDKWLKDT